MMGPVQIRELAVVMRELGVTHVSTPEWSIHLGPPTDPVSVDADRKPVVRDNDERRKFGHVSGFRGPR